jgi:hypothetical protein
MTRKLPYSNNKKEQAESGAATEAFYQRAAEELPSASPYSGRCPARRTAQEKME